MIVQPGGVGWLGGGIRFPGPRGKAGLMLCARRTLPRWMRKKNRRRCCRRRFLLVEAAGQLFHLFRGGLDYAFIPLPGCGACYPPLICCRVDPSAGSGPWGFSRSMSLYRAGLRLALFLPLGVAIPPPGGCRVRRCEPRFHSTLAGRGDHCVNRTRVRKLSALGSTCLARSSS